MQRLLNSVCLIVFVEQTSSDAFLHAEAGAGRFVVVISSITVLLARVEATDGSDL